MGGGEGWKAVLGKMGVAGREDNQSVLSLLKGEIPESHLSADPSLQPGNSSLNCRLEDVLCY